MKYDPKNFMQLVRGLYVMMDPGRDQDDEDVIVLLNREIRLGNLAVLGVTANLRPSPLRARLARGTLDILGQRDIPVGFGSGSEQTDDDGLPYEFRVGYLGKAGDRIEDGDALMLRMLEAAPPGGIVLTLISQLTDAAKALRDHRELLLKKVRRVVIMGGVVADGFMPKLDEDGFLVPDPSAQNHKFDLEATVELYRELQRAGIPLTIVSRHAAAAAKVPRAIYDDMAATGHQIGIRLRDAQREAIQHVWERTHVPVGDERRRGLPERCTPTWFRESFCGGQGAERTGSDSIWDIVESFMLYDPCTLIAAMPTLREYFYHPYVHEGVNGSENHIIGLTAEAHNVTRPQELAQYLHDTLVGSLMMSLEACAA